MWSSHGRFSKIRQGLGALFVLFEVMILKVYAKLKVSEEAMRANLTNLA